MTADPQNDLYPTHDTFTGVVDGKAVFLEAGTAGETFEMEPEALIGWFKDAHDPALPGEILKAAAAFDTCDADKI